MPIITIPDNIKEGQEITTTDINDFITQINNTGKGIDTRLNGKNIRNEGIDRRNIVKKQVQEVGDINGGNYGDGKWVRFGPVNPLAPPIWFQNSAGIPNPGLLSQSWIPSHFLGFGHLPFINKIPVQEGDQVIVTCSFAFSVFPLDVGSNNTINSSSDSYGGYQVTFELAGWPGTKRIFNTMAASNVQSGGYRWVGTQNTCTIVGYWDVTTETKLIAALTAKSQRSRLQSSPKDAVVRIKNFHMFAKIVRR